MQTDNQVVDQDPLSQVKAMSSERSVPELINACQPLPCWKVGRHYGSNVYFEMKDKCSATLLSGEKVEIGSATLSLTGSTWTILKSKTEVASSETVTDEIVDAVLAPAFIGQKLQKLVVFKERLLLAEFSDELIVAVEMTTEKNADQDLISLFLPDGTIISANRNQGLFVNKHIDTTRASQTSHQ